LGGKSAGQSEVAGFYTRNGELVDNREAVWADCDRIIKAGKDDGTIGPTTRIVHLQPTRGASNADCLSLWRWPDNDGPHLLREDHPAVLDEFGRNIYTGKPPAGRADEKPEGWHAFRRRMRVDETRAAVTNAVTTSNSPAEPAPSSNSHDAGAPMCTRHWSD
jgi:hypothetical protein